MRSPLSTIVLVALVAGCDDGNGVVGSGAKPQIVSAVGPKDNVVACDPAVSGGSCPLPISLSFRLAKGEIVSKAIVRFQGDGSDTGVDHGYSVPNIPGQGEGIDVPMSFDAAIPPTILRRGALFTYSVRLQTGAGEESSPSSLTVSVQ